MVMFFPLTVSPKMTIERIRSYIRAGHFSVLDHAILEGFKDGVLISDIIACLLRGKIIEQYPERKRCLVLGKISDGMPVHVVVDYSWKKSIDIVTVYIPSKKEWVNYKTRKKK